MFNGACVVVAAVLAGGVLCVPALGQTSTVSALVIQYQAFHTQTSTSPPGPSSSHRCSAFLVFEDSWTGTVDSLDVIKPSSAVVPTSGSGTFYTTALFTYPSRAALMADWPSGTYTFRWIDEDLVSTDFPLPQPSAAGAWPSVVPAFTPASYTGLQAMNPALPRSVEVNGFATTPPSNGQLSGLDISQRFGILPGPTVWSSLTTIGTPTAMRTIPANVLQPNTDYFATWIFDQRISTDFFPPVNAVRFTNITFGNLTRVSFRTGPAVTCRADFNSSGAVDVNDIFSFLSAWFANDPRANFNGVNGIEVGDIFAFLSAWFARC